VSQKKIPSPEVFRHFFHKRLGTFSRNFTHVIYVLIYAGLQSFIQLSAILAILTKLCYIMRDDPVHIICSKCPPSADTHAGIFTVRRSAWHGLRDRNSVRPSVCHTRGLCPHGLTYDHDFFNLW